VNIYAQVWAIITTGSQDSNTDVSQIINETTAVQAKTESGAVCEFRATKQSHRYA